MTQEEIAIKLTDFESRLGVIEKAVSDMKKMQEQLQQLVISVNNLATGVKNLTEQTSELKADMKANQKAESDNVKDIKKYVITSIIGLVLGFIFSRIL